MKNLNHSKHMRRAL